MRFAQHVIGFLTPVAAFVPASTSGTDQLFAQARSALQQYQGNRSSQSSCNLSNAQVRREWTTFSDSEKRAYIEAVLCIMSKPSKSDKDFAPGARSRYDDFLAVHIDQTPTIHGTVSIATFRNKGRLLKAFRGNFLSWHRYFTWAYEQALRNECGYQGHQPYLNWPRYAYDLLNAPIFDGSETSMSGNGGHDAANNGTSIPNNADQLMTLPPEEGGGCVRTGPFANLQVNLGPVTPALNDVPANPRKDGLGYNPRCLRRDISSYSARNWATDQNVTALLTQTLDIGSFQTTMQGNFAAKFLGVHTAGHFFVGGDPGGDLFASAGDPYFFHHHACIDRTWWIWQNLAAGERYDVIAGTLTINNSPPSRNATLDDVIDLGVLAPAITIRDAVNTLDGPFCYIYE